MSELDEKIRTAIERIRAFEPEEGYYLAFSGGKDSIVCKALLDMAGVKYDAVYHVTSVDPPELVRFIRENHPDVKMEIPHDKNGKPITMWNLIPRKMIPPTRIVRYCCHELKEGGGDGRMVVTGVRWAESVNRRNNHGTVTISDKSISKEITDRENFKETKFGGLILTNDNDDSRRMVEQCYKRHKTTLNPIIEWSDTDVWNFIKSENIAYCDLYDNGFHRIGCIGCPLASKKDREREFYMWPMYKSLYFMAFDKMLKIRAEKGKLDEQWRMGTTSQDVFNWWMEYDVLPGQVTFDDILEEDEDES